MKTQNLSKKMTRQESLLFLKSCKSSLEGVISAEAYASSLAYASAMSALSRADKISFFELKKAYLEEYKNLLDEKNIEFFSQARRAMKIK